MALPPLPADPPPGPTPFEDDVRLARAGDPRAFDRVCGVMGPRLHRYAATLLRGDVAAAEDVVQEALLAAWQALPTLRAPELLRGWLFSVTHRRSMGWLRTRARRRTDALADDDADAPPAPTRGAEGAEAEARARLLRTLRALPVHYMAPLSLCYLEGLGARETARVLSLSLSTLKMRLYRGRNLLRHRLVHQGEWSPHARKPGRREAGSRVAGSREIGANDVRPRAATASPPTSSASAREARRALRVAAQARSLSPAAGSTPPDRRTP